MYTSSNTRRWWFVPLTLLAVLMLILLYSPSPEEYVRGRLHARVIAWWAREGNVSLIVWGGKNVTLGGVPCAHEGNMLVCPLNARAGSWVEKNICVDGECATMRLVVD